MQDLIAGRAAVVTGGARGIGLAVVEAIAARGVGVLCLDHPDADHGAFHDACRLAGVPADHTWASTCATRAGCGMPWHGRASWARCRTR